MFNEHLALVSYKNSPAKVGTNWRLNAQKLKPRQFRIRWMTQTDLSEESLAPSPRWALEVYGDVVVLCVQRFLHEWLLEHFSIYGDLVIVLDHLVLSEIGVTSVNHCVSGYREPLLLQDLVYLTSEHHKQHSFLVNKTATTLFLLQF